jgi:hypothetical protein
MEALPKLSKEELDNGNPGDSITYYSYRRCSRL